MNNFKPAVISMALTLSSSLCFAQTVTIDHATQRFLGSVSDLDRGKYFVLHGNASDADVRAFLDEYDVIEGRMFWGPYAQAVSDTGSVGKYPAFKGGPPGVRQVQKGLVSTEHPRNAIRFNTDLTAAAAWAAEYFKNVASDTRRPEIFEPMNEPFVHAGDEVFKKQQPNRDLMLKKMARFFAEIGKKFDETPELANMKVIGYSSAWPSLERSNFGHWNTYQKMFMDTAGAHMDGFATHLYDGINIAGQDSLRSGSNSEAILDMIEAYSFIKWGEVKPHAITEYGGIERGFGDNYSDLANSQAIRSFNHIIFNLLERENDLLHSIPFITDKSPWHLTAANNYNPYGAVLFRPKNIGQPNPQNWEFTPRVLFYDLWKAAKGKRVDVTSDNPDIQVHAFADSNKLFVAVNNLDSATQKIDLDFTRGLDGLQNVRRKSLKVFGDQLPKFSNNVENSAPTSLSLIGGETVTLEYTFADSIIFDNAVRSSKYYANTYLQKINGGDTQSYFYDGVDTGSGRATLRMSIGRKHNRSKSPVVMVNGTQINVPGNWAGYDQSTRDDFFGTIEIPFSAELLSASNEVTVKFPDSGGHLASLILQVEKFDGDVVEPPSPGRCDNTISIPDRQWTLLSLPCQPAASTTVADLFADDILVNGASAQYGSDWLVYTYDPEGPNGGGYNNPGLNGSIQPGQGFWFIQLTGESVTLDMPADSEPVSGQQAGSPACQGSDGCLNLSLSGAESDSARWHLLGNPSTTSMSTADLRLSTRGGNCRSARGGCTLNDAAQQGLMGDTLWGYSNGDYVNYDAQSSIDAWLGFWFSELPGAAGASPVLHLPVSGSN